MPVRDPVFGRCVVRVTDRTRDLAPDDASAGIKNEYSRVQSFNADETLILARGIDATWYLYNAQTLQPLTTSNYFEAGHRLRIEVSSSNFPRFDRNMNTGGKNYDEATGVVAHNQVHHSRQYASKVTLTVVKRPNP